MTIRCFDYEGQETTLDALRDRYGDLVIQPPAPPPQYPGAIWELAEIHERRDTYAAIQLYVRDETNLPLEGVPVAWYWPGAPEAPWAGPAAGVPAGMAPNRAVRGHTDADGKVGFPMGPGAFYEPARERGPHALWMAGPGTHSALIWGLGMRWATNHDHLDLVYQRLDHQTEPPPPEPSPWDRLFAKLDAIIELLAALQEASR